MASIFSGDVKVDGIDYFNGLHFPLPDPFDLSNWQYILLDKPPPKNKSWFFDKAWYPFKIKGSGKHQDAYNALAEILTNNLVLKSKNIRPSIANIPFPASTKVDDAPEDNGKGKYEEVRKEPDELKGSTSATTTPAEVTHDDRAQTSTQKD